jgi:hypothetical protein
VRLDVAGRVEDEEEHAFSRYPALASLAERQPGFGGSIGALLPADVGIFAAIVQAGYHHLGTRTRQCRRAGRADPQCATTYDGDLPSTLAHRNLPRRVGLSFSAVRDEPMPSSSTLVLVSIKHSLRRIYIQM